MKVSCSAMSGPLGLSSVLAEKISGQASDPHRMKGPRTQSIRRKSDQSQLTVAPPVNWNYGTRRSMSAVVKLRAVLLRRNKSGLLDQPSSKPSRSRSRGDGAGRIATCASPCNARLETNDGRSAEGTSPIEGHIRGFGVELLEALNRQVVFHDPLTDH